MEKPELAEVLHTILENQLILLHDTASEPPDISADAQIDKTRELLTRIKE